MTEALNKQINAELYSAYIYMAMSAQCSRDGLKGVANWFFCQTQEEMTHALRLYDYVNSVGEHALLAAIDGPPTEFESVNHMFQAALEHEQKVTTMINNLVDLARKENDHATEVFLQWFVNEQVEEEESVNEVLGQLKLAGSDGRAMLLVDRDLGARTFAMPPDLARGAE
jgi:ferritin